MLVILVLMTSGCISSEGSPRYSGKESIGAEDGRPPPIAQDGRNVVNITLPEAGGLVAHAWILPPDWDSYEVYAERNLGNSGSTEPKWTMFHGLNSVVRDDNDRLVFLQDSLVKYDYGYGALEGSTNISVQPDQDAYAVWFFLMSTTAVSGTITLVIGPTENTSTTEPILASSIASYPSASPSPILSPATAARFDFHSDENGAEILLLGYETVIFWQGGPGFYEFVGTRGEVRTSLIMAPGVSTRPNLHPSLDSIYGPAYIDFVDYCAPSGAASLTVVATHGPAKLIPHYVRSAECPLKAIEDLLKII